MFSWPRTCSATSFPIWPPSWSAGWALPAAGNIGTITRVFEPTHGSAPKYAGLYKVNPIATFLAAELMLEWLGETEKAKALEAAVAEVISEGKVRTYDMGGKATTLDDGPGRRR